MAYRLGVDLGTTFTAAAVSTPDGARMLGLGNRALQVPSVLFVREDGELLVGEAAERRGVTEPARVVREFKRRVGDPVPLLVGGSPYSPQTLVARLLRWVVEAATREQGAAPGHVTLTHPANWGPFKTDLLRQALDLADLPAADLCSEPEAAAISYASRNRVAEGERIAVYDLGGGTFDVAVLSRQGPVFTLLGSPAGIEHLGGIDFDQAVFHHVLEAIAGDTAGATGGGTGGDAAGNRPALDDEDPATAVALARLRRDCVEAKEALSADTEAVIPVVLPGVNTAVRLHRTEFEDMIRPSVEETVSLMRRALRSSGTPPEALTAIVLVGGSSRIPLVSELLSAAFGRPLAMDTHPKHDIALGAALRDPEAAPRTAATSAAGATPTTPTTPTTRGTPTDAPDAPRPVPVGPAAAGTAQRGWSRPGGRRAALVAVGAAAALVAVVTAVAVARSGDPGTGASGGRPAASGSPSPSGGPAATTASPSAPSQSLPAGPPLPEGVMVYPRKVGTNWDIATLDAADGREQRRLTTAASYDSFPILSADRRTVVYVSRATEAAPTSHLRVVSVDGRGDRPLFRRPVPGCTVVARPARHGDRLALPCIEDPRSGTTSLKIVDLDGAVLQTLDRGVLGDPTFTPDGTAVVYWRRVDLETGQGTGAIVRAPLDGGTWTAVTPGPDDDEPSVSPQGDRIAFTRVIRRPRRDYPVGEIWTVGPAGQDPRRLTVGSGDRDAAWSPDGTRIAFRRSGKLWLMNADGTDAHPLRTRSVRDRAAAWSRT